jgi:acetyl-CoA synthetase
MNLQYAFDVRPNDVFACVADVGWITGHSFTVYAPLLHGVTTVMFESTPLHPDPGRLWRMVEQHQATQLYTSPTAVRSIMRKGDEYVHKYDRSSLRVLAIAGEPINYDAWKWLHDVVGNGEVSVVDTWWQTETGGPMGTPQPGRTPLKPGSCSLPMYGVAFDVVDADTGKRIDTTEAEGLLVISKPWPGLARTIHNDHQRCVSACVLLC